MTRQRAYAHPQDDEPTQGETSMPFKTISAAIVGCLLLVLFFSTYYTVEEYENAVVTRFGAISSIEGTGLHFKMPIVNSVHFIRTDVQNIRPKKAVNTYTIDNQEIDIIYDLFYRVPKTQEGLRFIWVNVQDYKERLQALAEDRLKAEMGKINTQHVAEQRAKVRDTIYAVIKEGASSLGLEVTAFFLTDLEYATTFKKAVSDAAAAKANVETRTQELEQERKRAEAVVVKAKGEADAYLLNREAEAKGIELNGKANAAAIEAQAKALAQNSNLVDLRKAERWDGKLPATMLSNVVPFMGVDQTGIKK